MLWKIVAPILCLSVLGPQASTLVRPEAPKNGFSIGGRGVPIVCNPVNAIISYGDSTSVTITLDSVQNTPTTVYMNSSNSSVLSVPSTVTVPANCDHVSCDATSSGTKSRTTSGNFDVVITAYANGGYAYGHVTVN